MYIRSGNILLLFCGDGGSGAAERGWPRGPAGSGSARSRAKGEAGGDGGSRPPDREPLSR